MPAALTTRSGGREPTRASAKRTLRGALAADRERAFGGRVECTSRPVGGRSEVVCLKGDKIVGRNLGARTQANAGFSARDTSRASTARTRPRSEHRFGRLAEGAALLREATRALGRAAPRPERDRRPDRQESWAGGGGPRQEAVELYRREFEKIASRTRDLSRCDFGAALRLAERGFDRDAIAQAIRTASPRLEERKPGHVDDYARRTSEAALRAHARALEQARNRDQGRER